MKPRVETNPAGLAVFCGGECVATLSLVSGVGEAMLLILAKDAPALEITLPRDTLRHLGDVIHRVGLEALFSETTTTVCESPIPRVPRAPHLPS